MPLLILLLAFIAVPIIEIYVILAVGREIGALPTVALLVAVSVLGAWLVRREGRRAWRALETAIRGGRMPNRELADGALVLIGGTLLLTPGFVTDLAGMFLVLPVTRPLARRLLAAYAARRVRVVLDRTGAAGVAGYAGEPPAPGRSRVVRAEVVDDEDPGPARPDR